MSTDEEAGGSAHGQICCLIDNGLHCLRQAGNASYNTHIQRIVKQRRLPLLMDNTAPHMYICDHHKNMIKNMRPKRRRFERDADADSPDEFDQPEIDFFQMPVNMLRRFKKQYKLQTRPGLNKAQLAETVSRHFKTIPVVEKEVIAYFLYMVKNGKNSLDKSGEAGQL